MRLGPFYRSGRRVRKPTLLHVIGTFDMELSLRMAPEVSGSRQIPHFSKSPRVPKMVYARVAATHRSPIATHRFLCAPAFQCCAWQAFLQ